MSKYDFYTAVRAAQTIIAENFATAKSMQYLRDAEKLLYTDHKVLFTFRNGVELGNENSAKLEKQFSTMRIPSTNAYPTGQVGVKMFAKVTSVAGDVITMPTALDGKLVDVKWVVIASAARITDRTFSGDVMMTMQVFAAICVDGWSDEDIAELVAVVTGTDSAEAEAEVEAETEAEVEVEVEVEVETTAVARIYDTRKPVVSQDTPITEVEQMVYDALTEIHEGMTNVLECQHMGNLYDMVMSGFTVYDEDVVTAEMVKRVREEWVSDMQEIHGKPIASAADLRTYPA